MIPTFITLKNLNKKIYNVKIEYHLICRGMAGGMKSVERRNVKFIEKKFSRSLVGALRMDRVKNEEVHKKAGIENVYVVRMNVCRMARRVYGGCKQRSSTS